MPPPTEAASDRERLLSAAARLQSIVPEAVPVGGTAAALHVAHRLSQDDDHAVADLRERFSDVMAQLESVAGWRTARQESGESALRRRRAQLGSALPYDLEDADLSEYRNLAPRRHNWNNAQRTCIRTAVAAFDAAGGAAGLDGLS